MKKLLCALLGMLLAGTSWSATLPAGYTELQYIESTGTQYIDTGITATNNTGLKVVYEYTDTGSAAVAGVYQGTSPRTDTLFISTSTGSLGSKLFCAHKGATSDTVTFPTSTVNTKYTGEINYLNSGYMGFGNDVSIAVGSNNAYNHSIPLFARYSVSGNNYAISNSKIYSAVFTEGNTISHDFVPAKRNSDNVVGMYDTVSGTFFTNAGSGTFTGGRELDPCRNLFDKNTITVEDGYYTDQGAFRDSSTTGHTVEYIKVLPNTTYTISGKLNSQTETKGVVYCYDSDKNFVYRISSTGVVGNHTFTTPENCYYIRFQIYSSYYDKNTVQLELGSTATEYVPYCANTIKIATTAYNSARFSPVVTELNDTIATIRSVVTNTINQTKAIADLQATKQTRPDETCPAGKKCLLVEDNDGQPHWYEIIESASRLPDGFTELEYIESTGTQYIDTGVTTSNDMKGEIRGKFLSIDTTAAHLLSARQGSSGYNSLIAWNAVDGGRYFSQFSGDYSLIVMQKDTNIHILQGVVTPTSTSTYVDSSVDAISAGNVGNGLNLYINARNIDGTSVSDISTYRYYYVKIWKSGTLVRDFVPAKNASGVIGMYDTVSGTFFTNQGSGTFVAGPEI